MPSCAGLGLLLCSAAVHKLRDLAQFRSVLNGYQIFSSGLIPALTLLVPATELLCGLGLFLFLTRALAAIIATTLFLGYGALLSWSLLRATPVADCGCSFGAANNQSGNAISGALIWRNLVLALMAMNLESGMTQRALGSFDWTAIILFTLIGTVFYVLANTLVGTQQSTRKLFHD